MSDRRPTLSELRDGTIEKMISTLEGASGTPKWMPTETECDQ